MNARPIILLVVFLGLFVGIMGAAPPADSPPGNDAIKEAIALLEARKTKIADKAEVKKVSTAIAALRNLLAAAPGKLDVAELIDNTENYKGKTITLELNISSATALDAEKGETLRDHVGSDVQFYGFSEKRERLNIVISIPKGLLVPKAASTDDLIVTFKCTEGNLRRGNEAVSIRRP